MGCLCCSLSSFVSIFLDAAERIALCTVCAMLTCCILYTVITVLILGIGIGFHYCFVSTSVDAMGRAAKAVTTYQGRSGPQIGPVRSVERSNRRGIYNTPNTRSKRAKDVEPPLYNNITAGGNKTLEYLAKKTIFNSSLLYDNNLRSNITNTTFI